MGAGIRLKNSGNYAMKRYPELQKKQKKLFEKCLTCGKEVAKDKDGHIYGLLNGEKVEGYFCGAGCFTAYILKDQNKRLKKCNFVVDERRHPILRPKEGGK